MFVPKKAAPEVEKYKKTMLRGCAFRVDSGHDFMDVIERRDINKCDAKYGVGRGDFRRVEKYTDQFTQAVEELKQEGYIVKKVPCDCSPACQYHANLYYLA